jgi:hypothetical protein
MNGAVAARHRLRWIGAMPPVDDSALRCAAADPIAAARRDVSAIGLRWSESERVKQG